MPSKDALKAPRRQLEKFKSAAREHGTDDAVDDVAARTMKRLAEGKPLPHKPPAKP